MMKSLRVLGKKNVEILFLRRTNRRNWNLKKILNGNIIILDFLLSIIYTYILYNLI